MKNKGTLKKGGLKSQKRTLTLKGKGADYKGLNLQIVSNAEREAFRNPTYSYIM